MVKFVCMYSNPNTFRDKKTTIFFTWIGSFKEYYCESGIPTLNELEIYNDSTINSNFVCLILQDIFPAFSLEPY